MEIRIKMVEHRVRTAKVIRDNRIKEVNREVNKVLAKIRMEDKPVDRMDRSLRIIRTVIRLDKEMPITLRMDKDNSSLRVVSKILEINRVGLVRMVNSSNREVNKEICFLCLVVEVRWDSRVSPVVMVVNKANKTEQDSKVRVLVIKVNPVLEVSLEMVKVKAKMVEIILMAIMMERKLLRML